MISASPPLSSRLRALGLAELLDETFRLYRREFGLFAGLALCVTLPGVVMSLIAGSYRSVSWMTKFFHSLGNPDALQAMAQSPPPQTDPTVSLLVSLLKLILLPVTLGAIVYATNEIIYGRSTAILGVLEGTLKRYWALAGVAFLVVLVILGCVLLITIPVGIWVLVRWGLGVPVLLAEDQGPIQALGGSWQLVEGRWWRTLGIFVVVSLMGWVASAILQATAGAAIGLVPGRADDLRSALIVVASSLAGALVLPVFYIALTLIYYDLRVRREGFDLDQLAQQAQPPSAA